MFDEGSLPIRQAFDDDAAREEERRLLYVGITRARVHLALAWAERRDGRATVGRGGNRRPSRFLTGLIPSRGTGVSERRPRAVGPGRGSPAGPGDPPRRSVEPDPPVLAALRDWRRRRAAQDDVPAFVIAHDTTLRAIADSRPRTLTALGRVKGMGPTKLERYGAEIIEAVAASDVEPPRSSRVVED
jgi:DNA helicase-2/ATP-dependent DNA helicase PcrA